MLDAPLKQVVDGLEGVPRETAQAYEDQKKAIDGREQRISDIVKMLEIGASEKSLFICGDALDKCVAEHRIQLLSSLDQIPKRLQARECSWLGGARSGRNWEGLLGKSNDHMYCFQKKRYPQIS